MERCEATLTEWQGVAVCEVCDWNENDPPANELVHGDPTCCDPTEGGCPECDPIAFPSYADLVVATRCRHGLDEPQCVTCTGKRDPFASYRKADGPGRFVKPYAELPGTVRGSFNIGQIRAPSIEVATTATDWARAGLTPTPVESGVGDLGGREADPLPVRVLPPATSHERRAGVPQWYAVYERGATPTWPDPDAYDETLYRQWCEAKGHWGRVEKPTASPYIRGLVMESSERKRGDVTTEQAKAWRRSSKYRGETWNSPVNDGKVRPQVR
jgi:hypothetical protein